MPTKFFIKTPMVYAMPAEGTRERFLWDLLKDNDGILYEEDLEGTGITTENISDVHCRLEAGIYQSDKDGKLPFNA